MRSSAVNFFLKKVVHRAMAMGGTMPPTMTLAIIWYSMAPWPAPAARAVAMAPVPVT